MTEGTDGKLENIGGNTAEGRSFTNEEIKRLPNQIFERHLDKTIGPKSEERSDKTEEQKPPEEKKVNNGTKGLAAAAAVVIATTGVGGLIDQASAEENGVDINLNSAVYEKGEVASENTVDEYLAGIDLKAKSLTPAPGPAPSGSVEITPDPEKVEGMELDLATGEYYKPLSKEERTFLVDLVNNPNSTESLSAELVNRSEIEYKDKLYGEYYQKLIDLGCTDENNLKSGGVWFYNLDNLDVKGVFGGSDIVFKNMVDKEAMTNYLLTNEGKPVYDTGAGGRIVMIGKDLYVYEASNGGKILLPKFSEKIMKGFGEAIKYLRNNGVENIDDFLVNNGVYVISAIAFDGSGKASAGLLGKEGFLCLNFSNDNLGGRNDLGIKNSFISEIPPETIGIRHEFFLSSCLESNLRFADSVEIGKSLVVGYNLLYLGKEFDNKDYRIFGKFLISLAGDFADYLHTTIDDPDILHQIHLMKETGFVEYMGVENGDFLIVVSDGLIK